MWANKFEGWEKFPMLVRAENTITEFLFSVLNLIYVFFLA